MDSTEQMDWLVERISDSVRGGRTPEQAYKEYCKMFSSDLVKAALIKFEEMTGRIRTLKEPTTLQRRGLVDWYLGPSDGDRYWPSLYRSLVKREDWSREAVSSLDAASTKIISLLQPPGLGQINTRGLVIGYVQSGKTANYSAVIAKAADVGYKFFIILSGLTNPLRYQTQERLERELVDLNRSHWVTLTGLDRDFFPTGAVGNVDAFLTEHHDHKVLCVVKKNATVLRRLLRWLRAARGEVLSTCPVLVIDDEADQASINTNEFEEKRTAINQRILDILTVLPKAAYVGYTATPFANVFIDPQLPRDLYPRDFIVSLPKPKSYFGAEQIFGREQLMLDNPEQKYDSLDMIRIVEDDEVPFLSPQGRNARFTFEPEITPSLEQALRYFWMATAARTARGDTEKDSTMLIHTSLHIDVHQLFQEPVQTYRDGLTASLRSKKSARPIDELRVQWDEEQVRVSPGEVGEKGTTFDELFPYLKDAISKSDIVVENSRSIQRLTYGDKAKIQIVIGGNTLSRGLTLKGLVVSFFVRATNAYDTLLQMGRWFGYRQGYADLPRIWMTKELEGYFFDLATVEQEIRNDIGRYDEGSTPLEFGVRVRTHPALSITSRLKMQATIDCDVSYRGQHPQTVFFKHKDQEWLTANINATKALIHGIRGDNIGSEIVRGRYTLFRNVPVELIRNFLREYQFHEESTVLQEKLLREYIEAQNQEGELRKWNVAVVGGKRNGQGASIDLGTGEPIPLLTRTRYIVGPPKEYANLRAIVSPLDRAADLNTAEEVQEEQKGDAKFVRSAGTAGLLLIYPIAKDSTPGENDTKRRERRGALDAVEHVIGVSFVFPETEKDTPQRYKTVDLSRLVREKPEWPEEEEGE